MALETGTNIDDLVATNPTAGDPVAQGDDHIRLIKTVLLEDLVNNCTTFSATNGSHKFPSGLMVKWGAATTDGTGTATLTFTSAFPSAIYVVFPSHASGAYTPSVVTQSVSAVSARLYLSSTGAAVGAGLTVYFLAIGR